MAKTKYYKLGEKASSFYDPSTKLSISVTKPAILTLKPNEKIRKAAASGHIREISEKEYSDILNRVAVLESKAAEKEVVKQEAAKPSPSEKTAEELVQDWELMSRDEILKKLSTMEEVSKEDLKKASKMKKDELVEYAESLTEEKEEDDDEDDDDEDEEDED